MDALFRIDGHHIVSSPDTAGPWDPTMQHGAAPSALVTSIAEAIPTSGPMQVVRITVDLMRPVPVGPLRFESGLLREGRKIQLCAVRLYAETHLVLSATVLKIRSATLPLPDDVVETPVTLPGPAASRLLSPRTDRNPFLRGIEMRAATGDFGTRGPAAIWYRLGRPVVEDTPVSQVVRAVVASDFANGVSSLLDFRHWTFLNADLSINFTRPPIGDWILLDAETWIGADGHGIAAARLADQTGYFGRAVQSLVIEQRQTGK